MDVTTEDSASDINANEKYQEISSISKVGMFGKKTAGCQESSVIVWGIPCRANITKIHPAKTARIAKNP
jgi:hypothetical protein